MRSDRLYLKICKASYGASVRCAGFYLERHWVGVSGVEATLWVNAGQKRVIICFVGTNEGKDWIANLLLPFGSYRRQLATERNEYGDKIITGVHGLVAYVKANIPDYWRIDVTGHSKGGGEAVEFNCNYDLPINDAVVFAAPATHNLIRYLTTGRSDGHNVRQYLGWFDHVTHSLGWRWHVGDVKRIYTGIVPIKRHLIDAYLTAMGD